jgi:tetratricopeptide (TPR) repeat protein
VVGGNALGAALELFKARQYPGVVAVLTDALLEDPDNLAVRLLRARALAALRRDEEAQRELRECLRRDPACAAAYRLLGELSLRRDDLSSAEIFLKEAVRLAPDDQESTELLDIVKGLTQPTVAVEQLPAATVTVGCIDSPEPRRAQPRPPRLAQGTCAEIEPLPASSALMRFGDYLVEIGALTPVQLRAVLAYHRSTGVRVGASAVALGFVSEPKVEWAAHAYHCRAKAR